METRSSSPQIRSIPEASLRRLPVYYHLLNEMAATGISAVSCSVIGRALNLDPTQVRKDIEAAGVIGKPKVGYTIASLIHGIEDFLGWNNTKEAFLAGAGSLGSALLGYEKFRQFGLNIVAAFDTDPYKVGEPIHGKEILHMEKLPDLARRMHIHLGVIATPAVAAQSVADRMVEGGIRAIWNFAPAHLRVPEFVILQNEDLYPSLASLSFKLEKRMAAERSVGTESNVNDPGTAADSGTEVRKSL
jgi:redox-sensing transcriptional repressor